MRWSARVLTCGAYRAELRAWRPLSCPRSLPRTSPDHAELALASLTRWMIEPHPAEARSEGGSIDSLCSLLAPR